MHATRLCMPHMGIKFKRGAIIYLSSTMVGQLGYPGFAGYSTTKVSAVSADIFSLRVN